MPSGWLKNQHKNCVGRKKKLGGSSRKEKKQSKRIPKTKEHKSPCPTSNASFDDVYIHRHDKVDIKSEEKHNSSHKKKADIIGECSICCEIAPLVPLLKNCNHEPQCRSCLRKMYVEHAQQDISNYPLQCYHPSCKRTIGETQLVRHDLLNSNKELLKHRRLTVLSKAYRRVQKVVHCPECDFPQVVNKHEGVCCRNCGISYICVHDDFSTMKSTLAAVESFSPDSIGRIDGWARCPHCRIIISKGDGCSHMSCICGEDFDWDMVLNHKQKLQKFKTAHVVSPGST